jgi:hypothetical protein
MNKMLEMIKIFCAFMDYARKFGRGRHIKKEFVDFLIYYGKNYNKYGKIFNDLMDDKEAFVKMCELRGFAAMARELGISRQAARKRYIKCGGNKRFRGIDKH